MYLFMDDKMSGAEWLFFEGKISVDTQKNILGFWDYKRISEFPSVHRGMLTSSHPSCCPGVLPRTGICPYLGTLPLLFPSAEQLVRSLTTLQKALIMEKANQTYS